MCLRVAGHAGVEAALTARETAVRSENRTTAVAHPLQHCRLPAALNKKLNNAVASIDIATAPVARAAARGEEKAAVLITPTTAYCPTGMTIKGAARRQTVCLLAVPSPRVAPWRP